LPERGRPARHQRPGQQEAEQGRGAEGGNEGQIEDLVDGLGGERAEQQHRQRNVGNESIEDRCAVRTKNGEPAGKIAQSDNGEHGQ
jgi:hypothetical protein